MSSFLPAAGSSPIAVSVVVCAYTLDRWDDLVAAVASAATQTPAPEEVIVVIDHNDPLLARARDGLVPPGPARVLVIPNSHGQGLSGARNSGVEVAAGDVVAFLDDDARARPGWLGALVAPFADSAVIGAGGRVEPAWDAAPPAWFPPTFLWVVGCSYDGMPTETAPIRNPIGANMAYRRDVLERVGGFSEQLGRVGRVPLGCEETELSIRAAAAEPGGYHVYVPDAVVDHRVPPARGHWSYFARRCFNEGLSKARVSEFVGADSGLASERAHLLRLPVAAASSLGRAARRRDTSGLVEAGAIVVGAALVGAGLGNGVRRRRVPGARPLPATGQAPTWVVDHQVGQPLPPPPSHGPGGAPYRHALILLRDGVRPLGAVSADLGTHPLPGPAELGAAVGGSSSDRTGAPEDAAPPPASVVVATRNRPEALDRCLDSLAKVDHPDVEIIVVDNGPADSTRRVVANHAGTGRDVQYLVEPRPGASRARNLGLRSASRELVAVTDDDVVVDPGWLRAMCEPFATDPTLACTTGLVMPGQLDTDAQIWFERWGGFSKGYQARTFDRDSGAAISPLFPYSPGVYGSGNNVAYRSAIVLALGGYDEALGPGTATHSGEELDLFITLITYGYRIAYQPAGLVWHYHRATDAELTQQLHDYGVGLAALLWKWSLRSPEDAAAIARRVPPAIGLARGAGAPRRAERGVADGRQPLPASLRWAERRGMLRGPAAYRASRRALAKGAR